MASQSQPQPQNENVAVLQILISFPDDEYKTQYQTLVEKIRDLICRPENQAMITDEFLAKVQSLRSVGNIFEHFLSLTITTNQETVDEIQALLPGFGSGNQRLINDWIARNPVPVRELTLEEKFAALQQRMTEIQTQLINAQQEIESLQQNLETARTEKAQIVTKHFEMVSNLKAFLSKV